MNISQATDLAKRIERAAYTQAKLSTKGNNRQDGLISEGEINAAKKYLSGADQSQISILGNVLGNFGTGTQKLLDAKHIRMALDPMGVARDLYTQIEDIAYKSGKITASNYPETKRHDGFLSRIEINAASQVMSSSNPLRGFLKVISDYFNYYDGTSFQAPNRSVVITEKDNKLGFNELFLAYDSNNNSVPVTTEPPRKTEPGGTVIR